MLPPQMPCATMPVQKGKPFPLGATKQDTLWNFAVYSTVPIRNVVIRPLDSSHNTLSIPLDPVKNSTGTIWHIAIEIPYDEFYYGYEIEQQNPTSDNLKTVIVHDPYAKLIDSGNSWGHNRWTNLSTIKEPFALAVAKDDFAWHDTPPSHDRDNLIIYEMHVRGFTKDASSQVDSPGTYAALIDKIPYLKQLGITCVELLPIHEFDETEYVRENPITHDKLFNYWGYSTLSFFSPMQRYASSASALAASTEFKSMVQALHNAEIEVLLDVVFNHTGEGNEYGRTLSFKGLADTTYYLKNKQNHYLNYSGCGNTLNCNYPAVADMIIQSLRHWVLEYHVDGFRFDLASIFSRGQDGSVLPISPIFERISQDPILAHCRLIAEPWDAAGLHQVGSLFQQSWHGADQWMEWNDDFRIVVRRFLKGTPGYAGKFATKMCGSQDQYGYKGSPLNSINYVTSHDGYTLNDLVSYQQKHNLENGEENRDGMDNNDSWNSGVEGPSKSNKVLHLRERQMKNFCMALMLAQGIPMMLMGDEYGHTKRGNNNTWCQDNEFNWFLWSHLHTAPSLFRFWKGVIALRKEHKLLRMKRFLGPDDIEWHGIRPNHPDWSDTSQFIAYTLKDKELSEDLYIAFNASNAASEVFLPHPPHGKEWVRIINTSLLPPQDLMDDLAHQKVGDSIKLIAYSACLLKAKDTK